MRLVVFSNRNGKTACTAVAPAATNNQNAKVVGNQTGDHGSSPLRNRMIGDLDYLIHVRVADCDGLYQRLTARVEIDDISASFVREEIRETTALPL